MNMLESTLKWLGWSVNGSIKLCKQFVVQDLSALFMPNEKKIKLSLLQAEIPNHSFAQNFPGAHKIERNLNFAHR